VKYAFVGVSLNENDGLVLHCTPAQMTGPLKNLCAMPPLAAPQFLPPYTGDDFNEYYGYNEYSITLCFWALVVYIVVSRVVAYLGLRYIKI
jgi:ATP-binding cassette subfamily G (WHITE) protein 2